MRRFQPNQIFVTMGAVLWFGYPVLIFRPGRGMDYLPVLEVAVVCIMLPLSFLFLRFDRVVFPVRKKDSSRAEDAASSAGETIDLTLGLALGWAINATHIFWVRSDQIVSHIYHYAWTFWLLAGCYHVWRRARAAEDIAI